MIFFHTPTVMSQPGRSTLSYAPFICTTTLSQPFTSWRARWLPRYYLSRSPSRSSSAHGEASWVRLDIGSEKVDPVPSINPSSPRSLPQARTATSRDTPTSSASLPLSRLKANPMKIRPKTSDIIFFKIPTSMMLFVWCMAFILHGYQFPCR